MPVKIYQTPYFIDAVGQLVGSATILVTTTIIAIVFPAAIYKFTWMMCGAMSTIFILLSVWNFLKHRRIVKMLKSVEGAIGNSLTPTQITAINEVGVIFTKSLLNLRINDMARIIWGNIQPDVISRIENSNRENPIDLRVVIKHSIAGSLDNI